MLLTTLIFLTVTLGILAGYELVMSFIDKDASRIRRRLAREFNPEHVEVAPSPLFKNIDELNLEAPSPQAPASMRPRLKHWHQLTAHVNNLLEQAELPLTLPQLAASAAAMALCGALVAAWFSAGYLTAPAALVGALLPIGVVLKRARGRRERLLRQLPGAFELMARVLRAGSSVPQALQAVGDAFDDPLAAEFASCRQQLDLGLRPEETYQEMAQRCGVVEMRIFVMAMAIQRQTGGNLTEVLDRLASVTRSRLRLRQQIRSLTAEGRLQGAVLVVLPFVVFGIMLIVNRPYAEALLEHTGLLTVMGAFMLVGTMWIRRIVNIEL